MAETCDPEVLLGLYDRADRLRPLLEEGEGEARDSPFMATEKEDQPGAGRETTPEVGFLWCMHTFHIFAFFVLKVRKYVNNEQLRQPFV